MYIYLYTHTHDRNFHLHLSAFVGASRFYDFLDVIKYPKISIKYRKL
jgi:hypothetical protein